MALVIKPAFAIATGAGAIVNATGCAAIRTFRPLIGRERTAKDAGALGAEWQRFRTFLPDPVERPNDRAATRADAHGTLALAAAQVRGRCLPALRVAMQTDLLSWSGHSQL